MASVAMSRRRAGSGGGGELEGMGTLPKTVGERMRQGSAKTKNRNENVEDLGSSMKQTPIPKHKEQDVKTVGQRMRQN